MEKPDTTKKQTIIGDVVAHIKPSTKLLPYVHPNIVMELPHIYKNCTADLNYIQYR